MRLGKDSKTDPCKAPDNARNKTLGAEPGAGRTVVGRAWGWVRRWGRRAFGVFLCLASWMLAVGLYSLGDDWFDDTVQIRGPEELVLHAIAWGAGETGGAIAFFLIGVWILWLFWWE